jgi:muramoyltetrapeptide carboxypeptidase
MRKPARLQQGDLIGVVAPGSAVDEGRVGEGVRMLERAGFRVRLGASVFSRVGYLAGRDSERLADLHAMFADPEVRGVIAARGGYGCGRLLAQLDVDLIAAHPKVFAGHSDLTFLLNHILQRAGLVTFHGPMVAGLSGHGEAAEGLLRTISGARKQWHARAQEVVQPGMAEGRLVGGCLSILVSMLGTPYQVETRGRLLFLEEVNEKPFRIDRMLTHLRQAGALDGVAGVIFGEMAGCTAAPDELVTVLDVVREAFSSAPYPVAFGLPSGHGLGSVTLPLGVRAQLAGERLTLLEAPVEEQ